MPKEALDKLENFLYVANQGDEDYRGPRGEYYNLRGLCIAGEMIVEQLKRGYVGTPGTGDYEEVGPQEALTRITRMQERVQTARLELAFILGEKATINTILGR